MKLIIEDDEGHKTTVPFVREEITVGRQDGNTIRLTERNVSRKHARFFRKSGGIFVEDLSSHNGIKVNGDRIEAAIALKEGDLVQIGDYDLAVQDESAAAAGLNRATVKMDAIPDLPGGDSSDNDSGATSRDLARQAAAEARSAPPPEPDEIERDPSKPAAPARGAQATAVIRMNGAEERPIAAKISAAPAAQDITPHDGPRLVMVSTELAGREYACLRTVLTIGRGDECDIPIDHRSLSREHARLERQTNGQWRVVDLGSANKVQVNGDEYAESLLSSGDIITLGHVKLRFVGPGEEFTFVPEGASRKRSPVVFIAAGVGAVAVLGVGLYFGVIRKPATTETPSLDNPKTTAPPPLLPKSDDHATAAPEGTKAPTGTTASDTPPKPDAVVAAVDPKSAKPPDLLKGADPVKAPDPKPTAPPAGGGDDVVVPDHVAATPDPKPAPAAEPAPPAHHDEPKHADKTPPANHGKPDKASKADKVAEATPAAPTPKDEANKLRSDAEDLMRQGQYDGAISKLRQALKLNPGDAQLHKVLGGCLANSGEMDEAAKEYKRFVDLAPNSPDVPKVRQMLDAYNKSKQ